MKFTKVGLVIGSLLFLLLLAGSLFYFNSYEVLSKKYKEYVEKVKTTLSDNEVLITQIATLQEDVSILSSEKKKLLEDLDKKEVEIVVKEKIIYKDGELIVPPDYVDLKEKYVALSSIYEQKSKMYNDLKIQAAQDSVTINLMSSSIDELTRKNKELVDFLRDKITKPVPMIQHAVAAGLGIGQNTQFDIAYQATLFDKYTGQLMLEYPFAIKFLVGIKL